MYITSLRSLTLCHYVNGANPRTLQAATCGLDIHHTHTHPSHINIVLLTLFVTVSSAGNCSQRKCSHFTALFSDQ